MSVLRVDWAEVVQFLVDGPPPPAESELSAGVYRFPEGTLNGPEGVGLLLQDVTVTVHPPACETIYSGSSVYHRYHPAPFPEVRSARAIAPTRVMEAFFGRFGRLPDNVYEFTLSMPQGEFFEPFQLSLDRPFCQAVGNEFRSAGISTVENMTLVSVAIRHLR